MGMKEITADSMLSIQTGEIQDPHSDHTLIANPELLVGHPLLRSDPEVHNISPYSWVYSLIRSLGKLGDNLCKSHKATILVQQTSPYWDIIRLQMGLVYCW